MQDKEEYKKGGHNTSQEENEQKAAIFVGQSQLYEGFGELHSASMWAQLLLVARNTLWRSLKRGVSIEEFARERGLEYPNPRAAVLPPPKEKHERAVTTALLIRELLSKSGYPVKNLKVIPLYSPYHKITYDDTTIGVYNYATDPLALSGGDDTYLKEPVAENLRIVRQGDQWQLHPDVKIQLVDRLVSSAEPIDWQEESSLNNSSKNRRRRRIVL